MFDLKNEGEGVKQIFTVSSEYQELEDDKKIEMLELLMKWAEEELVKIKK